MRKLGVMLLALSILPLLGIGQASAQDGMQTQNRARRSDANLTREVHHELALLPWYSVFDNLQYKVNGDEVTLMGQVTQPTLKSDAENVVKQIEGVAKVNNEIEILPTSQMDDQLRRAEYRAIYSQQNLSRYGMGNLQSIHIIVKGGHVTLEGFVSTQQDKDVATIAAKSVPNVFSVDNHLIVQNTK